MAADFYRDGHVKAPKSSPFARLYVCCVDHARAMLSGLMDKSEEQPSQGA